MSKVILTSKEREALRMLQDMAERYPDETEQGAAVMSATMFRLGLTFPAFINLRTAVSLERKGVVVTEWIGPDEGSAITLTSLGRSL